jgi:ABC-type transporter lipoprotein component MlaA
VNHEVLVRRSVARLFKSLDTPRRVVNNLLQVNERSLNLQLFVNVEDDVLDLYSAARNGHLQRRQRAIALAAGDRDQQWAWARPSPAAEPLPRTTWAGPREDPA